MKKVLFVVLIMMLLLAMAIPAFAVGQTKSDVCHLDDDGNYILINIADPAVDSHMAHEDAQPGDAVPNMPGYAFDDFCNPVPDADADGVPDAVDNCVDVANPDQSDRYGSTKGDACEDSNGDGTLDVDEPHICVSIDGGEVIKNGFALCYSTAAIGGEGANIAIAHGSNAEAYAFDGNSNTATATGVGARAEAFSGNSNTATATGDYDYATAASGDNNTVTATGFTATGVRTYATAFGSNNTVTATGVETYAQATGDNNTVTATGYYAGAKATGDNNTVTAVGAAPNGCTAEAIGDNVTVTCP